MSLINSDALRGGGIGTKAGSALPTPMVTTTSNDTGNAPSDLERLEALERAFEVLRAELIRLQVIEG